MPRCKICKEKFEAKYFLQKTCFNPSCLAEWGKIALEKEQLKKKSDWRKKKKVLKENLKTISNHIADTQKVFNQFIRLRDAHKGCVSCGKPFKRKYDAGHYFTCQSSPELRLNEDNVHGQCVPCNRDLHGNIPEYTIRIKERIGEHRFEELVRLRNIPRKYTVHELKDLQEYYKSKIKQLKNEACI